MKNVLITGGAGFIGSNLSKYLLKKKHKIFVIDNLSVGKKSNLSKKVKFIKNDILNIDKIKFKQKIDVIIHLAALAEIVIPKDKEGVYYKSNIIGLQKVLNFASKNKIKKFIFASSASVYGDTRNKRVKENFPLMPQHYYAYTKYIGEKMVRSYCSVNSINFIILRFFNVYGLKSNAVVAKFLAQKIQNKKITIYGNGKQKRDFIHINDISSVIYKLVNNKNIKNEIYNIGSGKAESIKSLKDMISSKKNHIFLKKRNDDIEVSISNISKIKKSLKWRPKVKFYEGVKEMELNDYSRLKRFSIISVARQINLIKKFNK